MSYEQPQGKYYYAFDEKIFLTEVPNKFVLSFDNKHLSETRQYLQRNAQIRQIDDTQIYNNAFILTIEKSDIRALMEDFKNQTGVKSVNPMYAVESGLEMGVTDEIIVQFKENVSEQEIDEMHKKFNVRIKEITELFMLLSVPIDFDALEVANAYQVSGLVNFSHPNFLAKIDFYQTLPPDPFLGNQYYLRNTGQTVNGRTCTAGSDINVANVWNITRGNNNIVIAVLDEGVTSNHPDLPNTRQIRLNGSNFTTTTPGNDPSPVGNDNHGNSCAGIIAASHNNEGIAGIAPNCRIMPIRIIDASVANTAATGTNFASYTGHFGGTSAACPQVSGVVALMLSLNPNLTQLAVVNAIRSTARKARNGTSYNYTTQKDPRILPGITWNERMGYGVVNALAAIQAACPTIVNFIGTITTPIIVTSDTTIVSFGDINVQNVQVKNGAKLTLDAVGEVNIIGDFEVDSGSEFEIK